MKKNDDPTAAAAGSTSDVFKQGCPARDVLEVLASKWTLLIIHALASGPTRTGALRRRIEGISEKMLSQTLKELERRGLVKRNAYPEVPPRVDYELTPLGRSLREAVKALNSWAEQHCLPLD
jgi:DNA-binding HxlR family transcriptional regulator